MNLRKHPKNTDVAIEIRKRFYVPEKDVVEAAHQMVEHRTAPAVFDEHRPEDHH